MTDDVDVLNKVLEDESGGKPYVVETKHGEIEFEMHRVSRARRQDFISSLPEELVEYMQEQAQEQRRDRDVTDISSLDDISDAEPDEAPSDAIFTGDAVREMEDLIVESLNHSSITDGEIRDFLDLWSDKQFYATTFLIVGISGESDGVESFRTE